MQGGQAVERGSMQGRAGERVHDSSHCSVRAIASHRRRSSRHRVSRAHSLLRRE